MAEEAKETSMSEDIEAAFEELDEEIPEEEESTEETTAEVEDESTEDETADSGVGDSGDGAEEEESEDDEDDVSDSENEVDGKEAASAAEKGDVKAPLDYSPDEREAWKDVPKALKERIVQREADMQKVMTGTAEARRTHEHISKLFDSYAPVLAAERVENPMAAVHSMFQTVAEMRLGSPEQKATTLANLVQHYGIDIEMLDRALSGQTTQDPSQAAFAKILDDRLAPIDQVMNQLNTVRNGDVASKGQAAQVDVAKFAETAEFISDVRQDMADLIDLASARGQHLPLKDAYERACAGRPDIVKIIDSRSASAALAEKSKKLKNKKAAASSLASTSSSSVDAGSAGANASLGGDLRAAWDAAS